MKTITTITHLSSYFPVFPSFPCYIDAFRRWWWQCRSLLTCIEKVIRCKIYKNRRMYHKSNGNVGDHWLQSLKSLDLSLCPVVVLVDAIMIGLSLGILFKFLNYLHKSIIFTFFYTISVNSSYALYYISQNIYYVVNV